MSYGPREEYHQCNQNLRNRERHLGSAAPRRGGNAMRGLIGYPSAARRALLITAVLAPGLVAQARADAHRHAVKAPYSVTVLDFGTGPHDIFVTGLNREGEATGYSVSDGGTSATALFW